MSDELFNDQDYNEVAAAGLKIQKFYTDIAGQIFDAVEKEKGKIRWESLSENLRLSLIEEIKQNIALLNEKNLLKVSEKYKEAGKYQDYFIKHIEQITQYMDSIAHKAIIGNVFDDMTSRAYNFDLDKTVKGLADTPLYQAVKAKKIYHEKISILKDILDKEIDKHKWDIKDVMGDKHFKEGLFDIIVGDQKIGSKQILVNPFGEVEYSPTSFSKDNIKNNFKGYIDTQISNMDAGIRDLKLGGGEKHEIRTDDLDSKIIKPFDALAYDASLFKESEGLIDSLFDGSALYDDKRSNKKKKLKALKAIMKNAKKVIADIDERYWSKRYTLDNPKGGPLIELGIKPTPLQKSLNELLINSELTYKMDKDTAKGEESLVNYILNYSDEFNEKLPKNKKKFKTLHKLINKESARRNAMEKIHADLSNLFLASDKVAEQQRRMGLKTTREINNKLKDILYVKERDFHIEEIAKKFNTSPMTIVKALEHEALGKMKDKTTKLTREGFKSLFKDMDDYFERLEKSGAEKVVMSVNKKYEELKSQILKNPADKLLDNYKKLEDLKGNVYNRIISDNTIKMTQELYNTVEEPKMRERKTLFRAVDSLYERNEKEWQKEHAKKPVRKLKEKPTGHDLFKKPTALESNIKKIMSQIKQEIKDGKIKETSLNKARKVLGEYKKRLNKLNNLAKKQIGPGVSKLRKLAEELEKKTIKYKGVKISKIKDIIQSMPLGDTDITDRLNALMDTTDLKDYDYLTSSRLDDMMGVLNPETRQSVIEDFNKVADTLGAEKSHNISEQLHHLAKALKELGDEFQSQDINKIKKVMDKIEVSGKLMNGIFDKTNKEFASIIINYNNLNDYTKNFTRSMASAPMTQLIVESVTKVHEQAQVSIMETFYSQLERSGLILLEPSKGAHFLKDLPLKVKIPIVTGVVAISYGNFLYKNAIAQMKTIQSLTERIVNSGITDKLITDLEYRTKRQIRRMVSKKIEGLSPEERKQMIRTMEVEGKRPEEVWKNLTDKGRKKYLEELNKSIKDKVKMGEMSTKQAKAQTQAIVRTEDIGVFNKTKEETYQKNNDIIGYVEFVATLDSRTTLTCISRDGLRWSLPNYIPDGHHKSFVLPPLHWACRSTTAPVMKQLSDIFKSDKYKDIFKKVPEAEKRRASAMGQVKGKQASAEAFFHHYPKLAARVLGKERFKLWQEGKISLQQLTSRSGAVNKVIALKAKYGSKKEKKKAQKKIKEKKINLELSPPKQSMDHTKILLAGGSKALDMAQYLTIKNMLKKTGDEKTLDTLHKIDDYISSLNNPWTEVGAIVSRERNPISKKMKWTAHGAGPTEMTMYKLQRDLRFSIEDAMRNNNLEVIQHFIPKETKLSKVTRYLTHNPLKEFAKDIAKKSAQDLSESYIRSVVFDKVGMYKNPYRLINKKVEKLSVPVKGAMEIGTYTAKHLTEKVAKEQISQRSDLRIKIREHIRKSLKKIPAHKYDSLTPEGFNIGRQAVRQSAKDIEKNLLEKPANKVYDYLYPQKKGFWNGFKRTTSKIWGVSKQVGKFSVNVGRKGLTYALGEAIKDNSKTIIKKAAKETARKTVEILIREELKREIARAKRVSKREALKKISKLKKKKEK